MFVKVRAYVCACASARCVSISVREGSVIVDLEIRGGVVSAGDVAKFLMDQVGNEQSKLRTGRYTCHTKSLSPQQATTTNTSHSATSKGKFAAPPPPSALNEQPCTPLDTVPPTTESVSSARVLSKSEDSSSPREPTRPLHQGQDCRHDAMDSAPQHGEHAKHHKQESHDVHDAGADGSGSTDGRRYGEQQVESAALAQQDAEEEKRRAKFANRTQGSDGGHVRQVVKSEADFIPTTSPAPAPMSIGREDARPTTPSSALDELPGELVGRRSASWRSLNFDRSKA